MRERAQGRQADWLVDTHHHANHTRGNPVFRPAARHILAHANVSDLQKVAAERTRQAGRYPGEQVYADTTDILAGPRQVTTAYEQQVLERSAAISVEAHLVTIRVARPGR